MKNRAECHQNCSQLGVLDADLLMYKENLFHKSSSQQNAHFAAFPGISETNCCYQMCISIFGVFVRLEEINIVSQNHLGWKRYLRSLSPTKMCNTKRDFKWKDLVWYGRWRL